MYENILDIKSVRKETIWQTDLVLTYTYRHGGFVNAY